MSTRPSVQVSARELGDSLGLDRFATVCVALLGGADRAAYDTELQALARRTPVPDWEDYWTRTWAARGLLHVWSEAASTAIVRGLADPHWRPAEMCLKVAARH